MTRRPTCVGSFLFSGQIVIASLVLVNCAEAKLNLREFRYSGSLRGAPIDLVPAPLISADADAGDGQDAQLLFRYTWDQQQDVPLLKRLEDKRKSMGVDETAWAQNLFVKDGQGNDIDLFDVGPDAFPVTVKLSPKIFNQAPAILEAPAVLDGAFFSNWDAPIADIEPAWADEPPDPPPWNGTQCTTSSTCSFINLDRRPDRRRSMEEQLKDANIQCTRMRAVDAKMDGILPVDASRRSHINALERLDASNATYGLIFEDDAEWQVEGRDLQGHLCNIQSHMKDHPVILLACNLDGHLLGSALENVWLRSTGSCQTSSAYAVRRDYARRLLKLFRSQPTNAYIDQTWKRLQVHDNWAMTWPVLVKQGNGYSDIEGANETYGVFTQA